MCTEPQEGVQGGLEAERARHRTVSVRELVQRNLFHPRDYEKDVPACCLPAAAADRPDLTHAKACVPQT